MSDGCVRTVDVSSCGKDGEALLVLNIVWESEDCVGIAETSGRAPAGRTVIKELTEPRCRVPYTCCAVTTDT